MEDEVATLESNVLKKVYAWLVVGGVAIGGVGGSGLLRVDKFTGTDGKDLERRIDTIEGRIGVIEYRLQIKHVAIEKLQECCREMSK